MDQSPAAFFYKADATDNGDRGATGFHGFGTSALIFFYLQVVALHIERRGFGSWPLFVNEPTCPDPIQRPEHCTQSFSLRRRGGPAVGAGPTWRVHTSGV